jgi:hypothetical protein
LDFFWLTTDLVKATGSAKNSRSKSLMFISVKVGSFAKITATGTQTITGLGFKPKTIIFYWSRNTTNASTAVPRSQGVGFTDCTNQRAVAIAEDDNASTSNAGRYRTASNVIVILSNGNSTVGSRATFISCNSDGFTINWIVSEARADIINYIAIRSPNVTNVKAGTFTLAALTGIQNITGVDSNLILQCFFGIY